MVIYADGSVSVFCYDVNGKLKIGNAIEQSLKEIWHSPALERLRNALSSGGVTNIEMCRNCDMACLYVVDLKNPEKWKKLIKYAYKRTR